MLTKRRLESERRCLTVEGGAEAVSTFIANANQPQKAALQPLPLPSMTDDPQLVINPSFATSPGGRTGQPVLNQNPPMFQSDAQFLMENGLRVLFDTSHLTPLPLPSMDPARQYQSGYTANAVHMANSGGSRTPLPLPTME